jgi:hypothetical protein
METVVESTLLDGISAVPAVMPYQTATLATIRINSPIVNSHPAGRHSAPVSARADPEPRQRMVAACRPLPGIPIGDGFRRRGSHDRRPSGDVEIFFSAEDFAHGRTLLWTFHGPITQENQKVPPEAAAGGVRTPRGGCAFPASGRPCAARAKVPIE